MEFENLKYDKKNGIAKLTINRPSVMNSLTPALLKELKAAVEDAGRDKEIGVVVITGEGRAFSAGVDLKALGEHKLERGKVGPILDVPARELIEKIQSIPKVVIAMINGYCFTGALEIVLGCDMAIASEDAKFGDTHAKWGLRPTWGMSQRLPRTVGLLKARELSFTAETIDGREAQRIGLVNMTVPADKLEETTVDLAKKIMANSLDCIAAYKYLYNHGTNLTLEKGLEIEFSSEFDITDTEDRLASFRKKS
jgi:enoyl-CoA hydratase/carnithine racemase